MAIVGQAAVISGRLSDAHGSAGQCVFADCGRRWVSAITQVQPPDQGEGVGPDTARLAGA
jgi:hypothetical protein